MENAMTIEIDPGNAGQLRDWDGAHGAYWAEHADTYDAGLARYQPILLAEIAARPGERILDVGCGSGQVAIDLARTVTGCSTVGVDLSAAQLAVGRRRAGDLPVELVQADAQVHDLGEATYDAVVSRTGTMFFADPERAFANLARAAKPGGRLVLLVWRGIEDNEWLREFLGAIGRVQPMSPPPAGAPGPFAQSDPDRVRTVLSAAGWTDVALVPHDQPLWFGPDADAATSFIAGQMAWLLDRMDDADRRQAVAELRDVMAAHTGAEGVLLGSGAWLVTAQR